MERVFHPSPEDAESIGEPGRRFDAGTRVRANSQENVASVVGYLEKL
jgi:hypothetical protein